MTFLPIVERELRVAARQPSTSLLRFLVALVGVILWLGLMGARSGRTSPATLGETLFYALTILLFACCLFAGVFLTADCLSVEKREGTLGLLFLTDLKGYDVVLGKLFSTSLRSSYGLVAGFPVLALPLLLGGVTVGAFWRVVLTLLATLFLSLTCGLFMSAVTRQSRSGLGGTFLVLFLVTAVLPLAAYAIFDPPLPAYAERLCLWPSPAFLLWAAQSSVAATAGVAQFWASLGITAGMAIAFLVGACLTLPLRWRERTHSGLSRKRRTCRPVGYGNPYLWLVTHGQAPLWMVWGLVVLGALISVGLLIDTHVSITMGQRPGWTFAASVLSAFGAHQLFKYMVAAEASRCFSEDRRNGTMELLMVSPLSPAVIIHGQRRALGSLFHMPAWTLIALNMFLILAHKLAYPYGPQFETWALVLAGGIALVAADYYGLTWTGMWLGLRSRRHHRAVMGTLLRVMMPSWAGAFLLFFGLGRGRLNFEEMLICWLFLGAAVSLMVGQFAQVELRRHFRAIARSDYIPRVRGPSDEGSHVTLPVIGDAAFRRDTA
jgi:ABC-type transport system involved in cytochrome c biogenesis permease component